MRICRAVVSNVVAQRVVWFTGEVVLVPVFDNMTFGQTRDIDVTRTIVVKAHDITEFETIIIDNRSMHSPKSPLPPRPR